MKPFYAFLTIAYFITCFAKADEPEISKKWITLSAKSQNLHHQLLKLGPDVSPDPAIHEAALKAVDKALNDLVSIGELESKKVTLIPAAKIKEEALENLFKSVNPIKERYGDFVAGEMCDLGARLKFMIIKPDESVVLHLRLPKKEMKEFITKLTKLKLIAKPKQS